MGVLADIISKHVEADKMTTIVVNEGQARELAVGSEFRRASGNRKTARRQRRTVNTKASAKASGEKFRLAEIRTVKIKQKSEVPVILSRRDVAQATGLPHDRIYSAATRGTIRPDFLDLKGAPFFVATRLDEISRLLKIEVVA